MILPIKKPNLENFTPHKGTMLLIDRIIGFDLNQNICQSEIDINQSSVFYDVSTERVPIWVSFEYMAQTIAALAGIVGSHHGLPPRIGFIMGVRDFESSCPGFSIGQCVQITVQQMYKEASIAAFECQALLLNQVVAKAIVNVIEPNDAQLATMLGAHHE